MTDYECWQLYDSKVQEVRPDLLRDRTEKRGPAWGRTGVVGRGEGKRWEGVVGR